MSIRFDDFETATFSFDSPPLNMSLLHAENGTARFDHLLRYQVEGFSHRWSTCPFHEVSPLRFRADLNDEGPSGQCPFIFAHEKDVVLYQVGSKFRRGRTEIFSPVIFSPVRRRRLKPYVTATPPEKLRLLSIKATSMTVAWEPKRFLANAGISHHFIVNVSSRCGGDSHSFSVPSMVDRPLLIRIPRLHPGHHYEILARSIVNDFVSLPASMTATTHPVVPSFITPHVFVESLANGRTVSCDQNLCSFALFVLDVPYCQRLGGNISHYVLRGNGIDVILNKSCDYECVERFPIRFPASRRSSYSNAFRLFAANEAGISTVSRPVVVVANDVPVTRQKDLQSVDLRVEKSASGEFLFVSMATTEARISPMEYGVITCSSSALGCVNGKVLWNISHTSRTKVDLPLQNRIWGYFEMTNQGSDITPSLFWRRDQCIYVKNRSPRFNVTNLSYSRDGFLRWREPPCQPGELRADSIRYNIVDDSGSVVLSVNGAGIIAKPVDIPWVVTVNDLKTGYHYRVVPYNNLGDGYLSNFVLIPHDIHPLVWVAVVVIAIVVVIAFLICWRKRRKVIDEKTRAYFGVFRNLVLEYDDDNGRDMDSCVDEDEKDDFFLEGADVSSGIGSSIFTDSSRSRCNTSPSQDDYYGT